MAVIDSAGRIIRRGGVVIFPTETCYGLGGDPLQATAVERIYQLKGRAQSKPLPLIAADLSHVLRAVDDWPPLADHLARVFWPGPLTLVLPAAPLLPSALHAHTGTIAIRISSHPVARTLADSAGGLLISTSANASGEPTCKDLQELAAPFMAQVDGILDAGRLGEHLPSTIVDVSGSEPVLLRAGPISWPEIEQQLHPEPS